MNRNRFLKYLDAADMVCSECKMGDSASCDACPLKISYEIIHEENATLSEIIEKLARETEDDEEFREREYEAVKSYCNKRNYNIDTITAQTIRNAGLHDAFEEWLAEYTCDKKSDLAKLEWKWADEEVLRRWHSRELGVLSDTCIGALRVGELCFDLVERMIDRSAVLWLDLYVGGIDSGYGYGKDDYSYDYFDEVTESFNSYYLQCKSFDEFKQLIKAMAIKLIFEKDAVKSSCSLIKKAKEPLKEW